MRSMLKRSFVVAAIAIVTSAMPASATTWSVWTHSDAGPGSLRQALGMASSGDTIRFAMPLPATITLISGTLQIAKSVAIEGPGASLLTVTRDPNAPPFGIFAVNSHVIASIAGITVSGGKAQDGAGILNLGTLTVRDAVLTGNRAETPSSGALGGGVLSEDGSSLTIVNTSIVGNFAAGLGGGLFLKNLVNVTVERSTIATNTAGSGGGIYFRAQRGSLVLSNTTVSNNVAIEGPAMTVSGNMVSSDGVLVRLDATTVAGNGLLAVSEGGQPIMIRYRNTIFSNSGAPNFSGAATMVSEGFNISSDATLPLTDPTDRANTDPRIGPLQMNGGSTATHALLAGSLAIDAGSCADSAGIATTLDQRGISRPQGGACDIGAVEADLPLATYAGIASLQSGVGQLQTSVASLASQASVNGLTQSLADLGVSVASKSSQSSVDAMTALANITNANVLALAPQIQSRATQTSVTDLASSITDGLSSIHGRIQTLTDAIPTGASIGAVQSAVSDVSAGVSAAQVSVDALTRLAIERALGDGTRVVSYMLPTSAGGQLEAVRTIVDEAIAGMDFMGVNVRKPSARFGKGDEALSAGDFRGAYDFYVAAYQLLVR